nr:protein 93 [synthetic construct]
MGGIGGGGIQPRDYSYGANGTVCVNPDVCFCLDWQQPFGSNMENNVSQGFQLFTIALSACILMFYAYEWYKATCGWEEIYVCVVEMSKICIELVHEYDTPFCLYLATGSRVLWLRYAEWLMTCPVILIHLSNITGLGTDYNKRTMVLLMSDIGCIVFGATAAFANEGYVKCACFLLGMAWGMNTFYNAAKVYYESYVLVPSGICKLLVAVMAGLYYVSWSLFPILFAIGPEGFGVISLQASTIGHTIADVLSKNMWGLMGHFLRVQIYKHILLHGNIRKPIKLHMLGEEVEVMALVSEEGEDTV